ncbi:MAG: CusA/CzcA family heavy metal efflux RND transporter, partial [candidate division Zixibacteria bacterium]|nr:CusA/CzcA family heavy metal efflux RND transporter [candidate division Zixibacteria bacterium]
VKVIPFYDRTDLIKATEHTLKRALIEESILVFLVILIFLGHFLSTFIVITSLPIGVLIAFIFMRYLGITSNIMSLGGIAIAIGVMVDAGIVIIENSFRHLEKLEDKSKKLETVALATKEVGRPIFFSMIIIILAFVPVFSLQGQEGKLFHPLAFTKTLAMIGASILAITWVPVLSTYFLRGKLRSEEKHPLNRFLMKLYEPVLLFALKHKKIVIGGALIILIGAFFLIPLIGSEFMPPLEEGKILYMPTLLPAVSLTEAMKIVKKQDMILEGFPEVESVVGKVGRAETATDPAPISMIETIINLKPKDKWRKGMTKEKLIKEMGEKLAVIPGVAGAFTQPIRNRIDMLTTGVRTQVGIKIFGSDLKVLEEKSQEIEKVVRMIPGAADIYAERVIASPYLEIKMDRNEVARYGIKLGEVMDVVETAIGGKNLTTTIEGRARFPVRVRYARELRDNINALKNILVSAPNGAQIPLSQLSEISVTMGPYMISSENGLLRNIVQLNVRGRDLVGFVEEAKRLVQKEVKLPPGYFITWSGQYENQVRAKDRLRIVVPLVLVIILMLLYIIYGSFKEAFLIIASIPFAMVGGILLLFILGYNFSVAVWVGFIALFGTAVETGVVMVVYLDEAIKRRGLSNIKDKSEIREAVIEGALLRLRPKLMTV